MNQGGLGDAIRKGYELFEPSERGRLGGILAAMVVTGILQTVGIASIMPFLAVVSNPSAITENEYLSWAYQALGFTSTESFIVVLGITFMVTMVASNGFTTFTGWMIVRFQWRTHRRLSHRLLDAYLSAPYEFHLHNNSARLGSTLLSQVSAFTGGLVLPACQVLSRATASAFIIALLVVVDPLLAAIVSLTIGGFYAVVYGLVRKRQARYGAEVVAARTARHRVANETFGGIKEVKVLGRESFFADAYDRPSEQYARANSANTLVGLLPRFALETVAYGGIIVVILYLLQTRDSLDQIFPLLAVYAFGANRLIPGVQEIFSGLTKIRFSAPAVSQLHADFLGRLAEVQPTEASPQRGPSSLRVRLLKGIGGAIRFDGVSFRYAGANRPAVSGVTLEIPFNRTSAFVGATGSGKTTLVDLLLGLFNPAEGRIVIGDRVLDATLLPDWKEAVGYVPQSIFLCDASIAENIALGVPKEEIDFEAVLRAARAAHLDTFVTTLDEGYDTIVGERGVRLSGGQRQRIGIARALYHDPAVLVLDEATSALDNVTEDVVMQAIRDLAGRRTILLIAHRLSTVRECDVVHLLEEGRLMASGSYDELVELSPTFRAMARV